jgi:hypothetical protein
MVKTSFVGESEVRMILHPTVLVLGAGASKPYGFPSGRELLTGMCTNEQGKALVNALRELGCDVGAVRAFLTALQRSGRPSVDAFLEHRRDLLDVGKAAIAFMLIQAEKEESLFTAEDYENWYMYLYNNLNTTLADFEKNRLSILTYNYDRSLEHFLLTAIENSYGISRRDAARTLAFIPIVHLHGQLGALPEFEASGSEYRPYVPTISLQALRVAAQGIRIIHEGIDGEPQFQKAHQLLHEAERVCFLGFGYDEINISRIVSALRDDQWVTGSGFGLTEAEVARAAKHLKRDPARHQLDSIGYECLKFLRRIPLFD